MTVDVASNLQFVGTLNPHQVEGLDWLRDRHRAPVAFDPGLGKTPTVIARISVMATEGKLPFSSPGSETGLAFHTLWVTEAGLIQQAVKEFAKFLPDAVVFTADHEAMRKSAKAKRTLAETYQGRCDVLVLSLNQLHNWKDELNPSLLVIDEAANLRNGGATNDTIRSIAVRTPHVIAITATIIENFTTDLFNVMHAIDMPMPWTKKQFEGDISVMTQTNFSPWGDPTFQGTGWAPSRAREVREWVGQNVLRTTIEGAGLTLPQRVGETLRWSPLSGPQKAAYAAAEAKEGRGLAALEGAILDASDGSPIVDDSLYWVGLEPTQQAVIVAQRLMMLDHIAEALTRAGISYARVQGQGMTMRERMSEIQRHADGEVQVLLGNEVLNRGVNLQHARRLLSVGSSRNPAVERQREHRVCRLGSTHETYEHLTLLPDTKLAKSQIGTLDRKMDLAREVGLWD